jgi:hypothetical protein
MNKLQNIALSQYCQAVQSSDWCFYLVTYMSEGSVCACGITNDYLKSLVNIRNEKQGIETEAYLFFCKDELTIRKVFDKFTSFLRYGHSTTKRADNPSDGYGHTWIYTDYSYLDRAFFLAENWFGNHAFRFTQTAFINGAFEEHLIHGDEGKRFLYPPLVVKGL